MKYKYKMRLSIYLIGVALEHPILIKCLFFIFFKPVAIKKKNQAGPITRKERSSHLNYCRLNLASLKTYIRVYRIMIHL